MVVFEARCYYFSSLFLRILQNKKHGEMFHSDYRFSSAPTEVSSCWVAVMGQIADVMVCLGWGGRTVYWNDHCAELFISGKALIKFCRLPCIIPDKHH